MLLFARECPPTTTAAHRRRPGLRKRLEHELVDAVAVTNERRRRLERLEAVAAAGEVVQRRDVVARGVGQSGSPAVGQQEAEVEELGAAVPDAQAGDLLMCFLLCCCVVESVVELNRQSAAGLQDRAGGSAAAKKGSRQRPPTHLQEAALALLDARQRKGERLLELRAGQRLRSDSGGGRTAVREGRGKERVKLRRQSGARARGVGR